MVTCIEAAELELQPELQQLLLRAAAYGKCYLPSTHQGGGGGGGGSAAAAAESRESALFVRACKRIRLLNAVRHYLNPSPILTLTPPLTLTLALTPALTPSP